MAERGWLVRSYLERRASGGEGHVVTHSGVPCGDTVGGSVGAVERPAAASVELKCDGSSGAPELERVMAERLAATFAIWKQRQAKYGSDNIARRGPAGIMVRMDDKLARLDRVFSGQATGEQADETVADTCMDVANYALMALVCHEGLWPGWPH